MDNGIKSKDRVKDFGEVFTPDSIVNDMLDLISEQIPENKEYITKTFLEPACGDGQFLIRILYRKLLQVKRLHKENRIIGLIKALSSIYGVDIQLDNVEKARERMFNIATGQPVTTFDLNGDTKTIEIDLGIEYTEQLKNVMNFILENNIIVGDTINEDWEKNKNGQVELIAYHFNDGTKKVKLAKALINDLSNEYDTTEEIDILSMDKIVFEEITEW